VDVTGWQPHASAEGKASRSFVSEFKIAYVTS
jgi:hypothetical protein